MVTRLGAAVRAFGGTEHFGTDIDSAGGARSGFAPGGHARAER